MNKSNKKKLAQVYLALFYFLEICFLFVAFHPKTRAESLKFGTEQNLSRERMISLGSYPAAISTVSNESMKQ